MNFSRLGKIGTVLLSPHQDDVALSVGGAVLSGVFEGPILLVSVFTSTSDEKVTGEEDRKYAESVKLKLANLGFLDAPLRNSPRRNPFVTISFSRIVLAKQGTPVLSSLRYALSLKLARVDSLQAAVGRSLSRVAEAAPDALLVSPLGIGSHPDHLLVANAARDLLGGGSRLAFYEDLPYAWRFSPDDVALQARIFHKGLKPNLVDITGLYSRKEANLLAYATQLEPLHLRRTREHGERLGLGRGTFERLWSLETHRPNLNR